MDGRVDLNSCEQRGAQMKSWLPKVRKYRHFDVRPPVEVLAQRATDSDFVEHHAFWPFIRMDIGKRRYVKHENTVKTVPRFVFYPAHQDAAIFEYYGKMLADSYETELRALDLGDTVLAYRPGTGSSATSASKTFREIKQLGACTIAAFDIKSFFDSIPHDAVKAAWERNIGQARLPGDHYRVFRAATKYAAVDREDIEELGSAEGNEKQVRICSPEVFRNEVRMAGLVSVNGAAIGIPQGCPLASVVSNMAMLDIDQLLAEWAKTQGGFYRRYSDDILVALPNAAREDIECIVKAALGNISLELNNSKTQCLNVAADGRWSKPLSYLGLQYDGRDVRLHEKSISRFYRKLVCAVRARAGYAARLQWDSSDSARGCEGLQITLTGQVSVERWGVRLLLGPSKVPGWSTPASSNEISLPLLAADKLNLDYQLFTRGLWRDYSHVGYGNFYDYARHVARVSGSKSAVRQLRRHADRLRQEILVARLEMLVLGTPWRTTTRRPNRARLRKLNPL
jgi:RNA-directed DNA polymerase